MNLKNILMSLLGIMGSRPAMQDIWATKESRDISNAEGKKRSKKIPLETKLLK